MTKKCGLCKEEKPSDSFYNDRSQKDGLTRRCKSCAKAVVSKWRDSDRGRAREKWRAASRKYSRSTALERKYGISAEDYAQILKEQNGCCKICGIPEEKTTGRNPGRLCVDHSHSDGLVRGLLCNPCNTALGLFKDSAIVLKKALEYISPREHLDEEE